MLERENVSSNKEELTDTQILEEIPSTISTIISEIDNKETSEEFIESIADVLELLNMFCQKKNINPVLAVHVAEKALQEKGTFKYKK